MRIAIDAMGGERGPDEVVRGAALASLDRRDDVELVVVGDTKRIGRVLADTRHDAERLSIQHAAEAIGASERPAEALAAKPDASLVVGCALVARGEADALVSAGPPRASLLAVSQSWKRIAPPALAAVYPTELRRGEKDDPFSLILDVGASADAGPEELVTYALMGTAWAHLVSKNPRPRVALLAPGLDGLPKAVEVAGELLQKKPGVNYVGRVEAVDIPRGSADVIVCAGFAGDTIVKLLEGAPQAILGLARYAYKERVLYRAAATALSAALSRVKALTDWQEYGGAPLLGYRNVLLKAHPRSGEGAIANAIRLAAKAVRGEIVAEIERKVGG
jgi:glycerol-3-phosphate acyltransferase PlsX